jgi:hypothetical protein
MMEEKNKIIKKRCENDPMYTLIFEENSNNFMNDLLELCIQIVYKKYGTIILSDKSISYVFNLLKETKTDNKIKRVAIIFFIVWETEIYNAVKNMYGNEGIFKENGKSHFDKFISKMNEFVEKTIKFPYSKYNIVETINSFDQSMIKEYIMGPFE